MKLGDCRGFCLPRLIQTSRALMWANLNAYKLLIMLGGLSKNQKFTIYTSYRFGWESKAKQSEAMLYWFIGKIQKCLLLYAYMKACSYLIWFLDNYCLQIELKRWKSSFDK